MCDTLCFVAANGTLFAKNSDRPVGEVQTVLHFDQRRANQLHRLRTQYLDLGPDPGAFAAIGSQPHWLWGFEHGFNEHRVAVGNEKVWTVDNPRGQPEALLGMDIVRITLERARTADEAFAIITMLVEHHGQGGTGEEHHDEPYHSSFLVADPHRAWIIETSDTTWAARSIAHGGASLSNRIALDHDWSHASANVAPTQSFQEWRAPKISTSIADHRLRATTACVAGTAPPDPGQVVATLRSHGSGPWGNPYDTPTATATPTPTPIPHEVGDDHEGVSVCMHVCDYQTTTASMVTWLPRDGNEPVRAWCLLGSPCVGIYLPVASSTPNTVPTVPQWLSSAATWQRFDRLRIEAESDGTGARLLAIRAVLGPLEAELWHEADTHYQRGHHLELAVVTRWTTAIDTALSRLGA